MPVICQYCHRPAELSSGAQEYPDHPHLARKKVWVCRFCDARVGCHDDTDVPLGSLADGKLRAARQAGHGAFDTLWREMWCTNGGSEQQARSTAYAWLADQLGIPAEQCRFAGLEYEMCLRATLICREMQAELDQERGTGPLV